MVHLTRIYTRAGDTGTTRLVDNTKASKTDPRLEAYADVDETNAAIGAALALGGLEDGRAEHEELRAVLTGVQNDLFDVGADLGNPVVPPPPASAASGEPPAVEPLRVLAEDVARLETECDRFNERLAPLRSFVLPGGTRLAALLHVARTVARRAERTAWKAYDEHGDAMNPEALRYLNRLSDLLFVLARVANTQAYGGTGDVLWKPGGSRS